MSLMVSHPTPVNDTARHQLTKLITPVALSMGATSEEGHVFQLIELHSPLHAARDSRRTSKSAKISQRAMPMVRCGIIGVDCAMSAIRPVYPQLRL
jgi:hypothetical protein